MPATPQSLNELGDDLLTENRLAEALEAFRMAAELAPGWSVPWYNLGFVHKLQRNWAESLRCYLRATELDPDDGDSWWNLGIAATALGDWAVARRAWTAFGIPLREGDGPPEGDFGPVPIRLDPGGRAEVVWTDRIDPARAVIRSVPLPESGRREGDLVLHDGAPNGYRMLGDRQVPVFDEIQLLRRSDRITVEAYVRAPSPADIEALHAAAGAAGLVAEDWTGSVRILCALCSEGIPHAEHDCDDEGEEWEPRRRVGISADSLPAAAEMLRRWARWRPGRMVERVRPAG